jgi:UDP-N-acetylglucosamine 2-epimerase (non-hydrolysing)
MPGRVLVLFGTKMEAIKVSGVIVRLKCKRAFEIMARISAQHSEMLYRVLKIPNAVTELEVNPARGRLSPGRLSARFLPQGGEALDHVRPGGIAVRGDTAAPIIDTLPAHYRYLRMSGVS